jgi:hypothetical protein
MYIQTNAYSARAKLKEKLAIKQDILIDNRGATEKV